MVFFPHGQWVILEGDRGQMSGVDNGGCPSTKHCRSSPSAHPISFSYFPHQHRDISLTSHLLHSPVTHPFRKHVSCNQVFFYNISARKIASGISIDSTAKSLDLFKGAVTF